MHVHVLPGYLHLQAAVNEAIPRVILGGLTLFAGLIVLLLPDTTGTTLPQTVEEANKLPVGMAACRKNKDPKNTFSLDEKA